MPVRVGCSGWSYRHWVGPVYPEGTPAREWFGIYRTMFDTVEINNTFYRLPSESAVDGWSAQAPAGFTYAVKVGGFGTHRRKLLEPGSWLPRHLDRVLRLGPSLGPNLVQLPPRWPRHVGRLDEFLAVAPGHLRWAVEFRDPSWIHDDVFEVLSRHRAALCLHDLLPGLPSIRTTDWVYLRFHGPQGAVDPYRGRYTGRRLWRTAERIESWTAEGCDVFAYFNNDERGHAVADATWLADRLGVGPRAGHVGAGPRAGHVVNS